MAGRTKKCAAPGCDERTAVTMLMCPADWSRVPMSLRRQVSEAWKRFNIEPGSDRLKTYLDARKAAIESVTQKEAADGVPAH